MICVVRFVTMACILIYFNFLYWAFVWPIHCVCATWDIFSTFTVSLRASESQQSLLRPFGPLGERKTSLVASRRWNVTSGNCMIASNCANVANGIVYFQKRLLTLPRVAWPSFLALLVQVTTILVTPRRYTSERWSTVRPWEIRSCGAHFKECMHFPSAC